MWWLANSADRSVLRTLSPESPNWTVVEAAWLRLRHGQFGPATGLRRVDVPGCCLLVVGFCVTSDDELGEVAARVARGDFAALGRVDGSRVVIAVRRDDLVVTGDLAGQHVVFFAHARHGEVVMGSHARRLAQWVDQVVDPEWLAARLIVPGASDVWWTGSPWQGLVLLCERTGKLHRCNATAAAMWTALVNNAGSLEITAAAIAQRYGMDLVRVRSDLDAFLRELSETGLVRITP